ncbi:hypothetical protein [Granulosicoccus antarcticus]|uniref:Uncharacterized protein n=1 Tax=Granulosicoccus antarcticus IMCC3135 TaxID=1192854 RepID=A0A2Z2NQX6_9GAMM|nr:hypothetical protein [Granulosicoccus antarcticus]ASJ72108.1 hypothetical protein IMCC3135_10070 [Granulosicoccus antarcticus IMCC3135]
MIVSTKSLLDVYRSEIGDLGGDDETSGTSLRFDRFVMILIIAFSLAISAMGVMGMYKFLSSENFGLSILSLFFVVVGVYSALGVYREFVSMDMISKMLPSIPGESQMEVIRVLLDKDRNLTLIDRLLSMIENIFPTKQK